jgi:transposase InsO family protein
VTSRVLTVWFLIHHGRRKIVHFDITEHPTAPWVSQQLRESFPHESGPSSLVFDHDSIFAQSVVSTIQAMGIEAKRIAARSPWQNGVAERWIGSCRRVPRAEVRRGRARHRAREPGRPWGFLARFVPL